MTLPPALVFASLTIREASRRRLLVAILILTLVIVIGSGWGFAKLPDVNGGGRPLSPVEVKVVASQLLIVVAFLFAGVLALSSVLVAAPSISGEVESNLVLALLARPVSRASYVLGKWIGLGALVVAYAVVSGVLELVAVAVATGYVPPQPVELIAAIAAEGLVLLTLSTALSTRLPGMTAGIIALVMYFIAWIGGIVEGVGTGTGNATLSGIGLVVRLILPTDALWRQAVYAMEPASMIAGMRSTGALASAFPFAATDPIPPAMIAWVVIWVVVLLALATWSFRHREL
jgi:ABC-type transport system involved in multi-copper enzyme maturation permease subunit